MKIYSNKEATEIMNKLEKKYGITEHDYCLETVYNVDRHYEARTSFVATESELENDDIEDEGEPNMEDMIHEEREEIGVVFCNFKGEKFNVEELLAGKGDEFRKLAKYPAVCPICGTVVIPTGFDDKRIVDGYIFCIEHLNHNKQQTNEIMIDNMRDLFRSKEELKIASKTIQATITFGQVIQ